MSQAPITLESAQARARQEAGKANCIAISNTKLAASLDSLGFPSNCAPVESVNTGKVVREFMFQPRSIDPGFKHLSLGMVHAFESGTLEAATPMHPLCVAMRAQHNYDRIVDMHHGAVMNLRSIMPGQCATKYKRAQQPSPRSHFSTETLEESNLCLVAALAGLGLPVLAFEGDEGSRRYTLPRFGYALNREDGTTYLEDAELLVGLAPTAQDPYQLALAETDPLHPVVIGYNALRSRVRLSNLLKAKKPRLLVEDGGLKAMVTVDYTGRVMDKITQRFGAPVL